MRYEAKWIDVSVDLPMRDVTVPFSRHGMRHARSKPSHSSPAGKGEKRKPAAITPREPERCPASRHCVERGLAGATLDAVRVNWPGAERKAVALVCCTSDVDCELISPHRSRAAIAALVALLVNGARSGAVVTCTAIRRDDDAIVSVETRQYGACILNVAHAVRTSSTAHGHLPRQAGMQLDLWRAFKLANLADGHLSFAPRRNGAIAFELHVPAE